MEKKLWFTITQDEARKIAAHIRPIASRLKEGEVIRADKTVGPEPRAGMRPQEILDGADPYAADAKSLEAFASFCDSCAGFKIS